MFQHRPAVLREWGLEKHRRSHRRIVHSEIDVKSWAQAPPSCSAARPSSCVACGAASREPGKPIVLVGHGLRPRTVEGPTAPGETPTSVELAARRYACRACDAIVLVVPLGVGRGTRYTLEAIAYALALWGYAGAKAAAARAATSAARARGFASPEQWSSLRRWTACAVALFGAPMASGTLRERAARVAAWLASRAPVPTGSVPQDAFFGGRFAAAP